MSDYQVRFKSSALKQLRKLPKQAQQRIIDKITALGDDPRPASCRKLKARVNQWRIRVGDYRIIYTIEDEIVMIVRVGDRRDVY